MSPTADSRSSVLIGLDLANVFSGCRPAASRRDEPPLEVRLSAAELRKLAADGRNIHGAFAAINAGVPGSVLSHFRDSFQVLPVALDPASQREIAGDEILQNALLYEMHAAAPGVLVLITGDGARGEVGRGFRPLVTIARREGWGVEVLAWRDSANQKLVDLANEVGVFVALDDWYYAITFRQGGGRRPQPVPIGHRAVAKPHPWTAEEARRVRSLSARWRKDLHLTPSGAQYHADVIAGRPGQGSSLETPQGRDETRRRRSLMKPSREGGTTSAATGIAR